MFFFSSQPLFPRKISAVFLYDLTIFVQNSKKQRHEPTSAPMFSVFYSEVLLQRLAGRTAYHNLHSVSGTFFQDSSTFDQVLRGGVV